MYNSKQPIIMLQAKVYGNERQETGFLSSRKIETSNGSLLLLQVSFHDAKLGSFIENTIIDLILTNSVAVESDVYTHFGYLLERLNKYFKEIEKESDFESLSVFIGIAQESTLHFSVLKNAFAYLLKEGKIMNIAEGMGINEKIPQFSYISSGAIGPDDTLCISNTSLLDYLTTDDMFEMTNEKAHSREETDYIIENLLSREIRGTPTDLILLYNPEKKSKTSSALAWDTTVMKKILSSVKQQGESLYAACRKNEQVIRLIAEARKRIDFNNKYLKSGLFGLGVIVCV